MSHALIAAIIFIAAVAASATLVPQIVRLSHRLGLLKQPRARDEHAEPIPAIGGLAIYLAFLVGIVLSFWLPVVRFPVEVERILLLTIGAAFVVFVMLYDDLMDLPPLPKFAWQIGAALVVIVPRFRGPSHGLVIQQFTNPFGGTIHLPLIVAMLFTLFWILGMMNTLNWQDGQDGLVGSITFIACAVLFYHTYFRPEKDPQFTISLLAIALGGAVLGFMPFNWHPAKIIMGDTGAMFLGFALAVISIIGGAKIATALLTLWVPILDIGWVIVYRVLNRQAPWHADRGHLHQRLRDLGWSHQQIVLLYAVITALFGLASLALTPEAKLVGLVAAGIVGIILLSLLARYSGKHPQAGVREAAGAGRRGH
ncbi:MAG TPA: MraY family glycosyltransferase [Thermomicrobiaceae bacterium]|nr:MraY family glycosyltransferase [Thermomicrobiaceae bacterium]